MTTEHIDLTRKRARDFRIVTEHCTIEIMQVKGEKTVVHVTANAERSAGDGACDLATIENRERVEILTNDNTISLIAKLQEP